MFDVISEAVEEGSVSQFVYDEVRIENTNHCGYKCFFCPREELSRAKGYMSLSDLDLVLDRVDDHRGQVDLHGFGEPLLDTLLPEKVRKVSSKWPEAKTRIISTLGFVFE